jgi:hypothetical protein
MLPIVRGCKAVITHSKKGVSVGKVVDIIDYIGKVKGFTGCDRWAIKQELETVHGNTAFHERESHLMRIDGYKEETKTTSAKNPG